MRFEDLNVWKRSLQLSCEIYTYFKDFRDFGFKDQITRAALSIPSNISEGHERNSEKDFIKFLSYSRGSCGEVRTQLYVGITIGYVDESIGGKWVNETIELSKMLTGLMKTRSKKIS